MHSISTFPLRLTRAASSTVASTSAIMPATKQPWTARFLCMKSNNTTTAIQTMTKPTLPFRRSTQATLLRQLFTSSSTTRTYATKTKPKTPLSASSSSSPASEPLTWNRFLALRKTRRRFSLGSSIICAVLTLGIGGSQLLNTDADNAIAAALGTEPMLVWGLSSVVLVAVGWLLGPAFGNGIFKMRYSKHRSAMDAKEREFFLRIKKHRSNPANSSLSNPIPDYYGEKIGSVADYRRWLKDQRAFNLKRGEVPS